MNAIPTVYDGIEYRSRLEARWGAFFTGLFWQHTYEPFDGDGYIPDFVIHGDRPLAVEIKPATLLKEYEAPIEKVTRGLTDTWDHDILILGLDPMPQLPKSPNFAGLAVAGLIGEWYDTGKWSFNYAAWIECGKCHAPAVFHTFDTYVSRPCGHQAGDDYLGRPDVVFLGQTWAEACNNVKWRGRAA